MTDLQTLLAAAERLENPEYATARQDRQLLEFAMADLLRPLLPGRPVPIESNSLDIGADYWLVCEESWDVHRWTVCGNGIETKDFLSAGNHFEGYRTRAEADREAYYRRFEALLKQAGELAQGDGR